MHKHLKQLADRLYLKDRLGNPDRVSIGNHPNLNEKQKLKEVINHLKAERIDAETNLKWVNRLLRLAAKE